MAQPYRPINVRGLLDSSMVASAPNAYVMSEGVMRRVADVVAAAWVHPASPEPADLVAETGTVGETFAKNELRATYQRWPLESIINQKVSAAHWADMLMAAFHQWKEQLDKEQPACGWFPVAWRIELVSGSRSRRVETGVSADRATAPESVFHDIGQAGANPQMTRPELVQQDQMQLVVAWFDALRGPITDPMWEDYQRKGVLYSYSQSRLLKHLPPYLATQRALAVDVVRGQFKVPASESEDLGLPVGDIVEALSLLKSGVTVAKVARLNGLDPVALTKVLDAYRKRHPETQPGPGADPKKPSKPPAAGSEGGEGAATP
jgi:hypothetical protein